jgi:hypothetical protein
MPHNDGHALPIPCVVQAAATLKKMKNPRSAESEGKSGFPQGFVERRRGKPVRVQNDRVDAQHADGIIVPFQIRGFDARQTLSGCSGKKDGFHHPCPETS